VGSEATKDFTGGVSSSTSASGIWP
jgi:hypothetical protein